MHDAVPTPRKRHGRTVFAATLVIVATGAGHAIARDNSPPTPDWQWTGTFGVMDTHGSYGTAQKTNVFLSLATISVANSDFKFSASVPYMRISGRGLVLFNASGNPIVVNRRAVGPADVRTGWGDLNLSASYTIPSSVLDDFELRISGLAKLPTAPSRRRLNTGEADIGMSVDVSRQWGAWGPFLTVGYMDRGQPRGYTLYNTTSVSAGTSLQLRDDLVAVASYDYDSADSPLVPSAHQMFGSLSWIRGLTAGSPDLGAGLLISYGLN